MNMQEVIAKLLITYPFYGYILSTLNIVENRYVKKLKIVMDPSLRLIYNKDHFNTLKDDEKLGLVLHEVLHLILHHQNRRGDRELHLWSVATDIAVNQFINSQFLFEDQITLELINRILNLELKEFQTAEFYYDFLWDYRAALIFEKAEKIVGIKDDSGRIFNSELMEEEPLTKLQQSLIEKEVLQGLEFSGNRQNINGFLQNEIREKYFVKPIDWRVTLKRFLSRNGKVISKKSYKRVSRRFDNYPGTLKSKGLKALIALDESGSMSDGIIDLYMRELRIINKITGGDLKIVRFDSDCSTPQSINDYLKGELRERRGSTDFRPIFQLADSLKIRDVVIFTDGDGVSPISVNQRVLWLLTDKGVNRSGFGETLNFERVENYG